MIGIAWDKISVEEIMGKDIDKIKEIVMDKYADYFDKYEKDGTISRVASIWAKEINYFVNEIRDGDIVLVKDRSRNKLMFGKIISPCFENEEKDNKLFIDSDRGTCNKARRIEWLKIKEKDELSDLINRALYERKAVVKITGEKIISDINKSIFSIFYRGDNIHAVFSVNTEHDIKFKEYYEFINLLNLVSTEMNVADDLFIKSNVSSPGPIEIFGNAVDIIEILKNLGIVIGATSMVAFGKYTKNYLQAKRSLDLTNPGEDDGFTRGN